ncbi:SpoIIE family protein phosphatase [Streptomyces sp. NPDC005385]|uniref:SpoIIE family protein phosphatase n=1 Tax=Streptomyces sp. NPDC005385 TaxID=3157039 RepID=UPI0033B1249E
MDRFVRLTASVLDATGAVVALASPASGPGSGSEGEVSIQIAETWPSGQPQSVHALTDLCERVAYRAGPFVLDSDDQESLGAAAEGIRAFAGVPLRGEGGALLGVLGAFDASARGWNSRNLQDLADMADACAAELRISEERARDARHHAEVAQRAAETDAGRAREGAGELKGRLERSELLLRAAELLGNTSGLEEVRRTVSELVSGDLKPAYVGLTLREADRLHRSVDEAGAPVPLETATPRYGLWDGWPSAQAARENRIVNIPDRQALIKGYDPQTVAVFDEMGLQAAICVPLPGTRRATLGTLVVAWDEPHEVDLHERAVLTVIAGYTAVAVQRALHLDDRVSVARQLQQAMLTDLPPAPGLELATLYRPAADQDMVGGDWYDAYPLATGHAAHDRHPEPAATDDQVERRALTGTVGEDERRALAVTVGDITGHNMHAATLMGQARSMLRQADIDRSDSPARAVTSMERANRHLDIGISGTLIHAHLIPHPHGRWLLRWTNAGHLPPLLARPHHDTEYLSEHAHLIFPGLVPHTARPVHERILEPGDLLLLYTDGLVEHPRRDLAQLTAHAARLLTDAAGAGTPLPQLLNQLADTLAGPEHNDDIVLLALRITATDEGRPCGSAR